MWVKLEEAADEVTGIGGDDARVPGVTALHSHIHTSPRGEERVWWDAPLEPLRPDLGPHEDEVGGGGLEGHDAREELVDAVAECPQVAEPHTAQHTVGG